MESKYPPLFVSDFISGDGGPMIVIQAGAVPLWTGAAGWATSRMNGGTIETDYDVICSDSSDWILHRHGRDMLVLDDSEWGGYLASLPSGETAIVQCFGWDDPIHEFIQHALTSLPTKSCLFNMKDTALRLLVGADDGRRNIYGYQEVTITPGTKKCNIYEPDAGLLVLLSDNDMD